ncbi:MAG: hypothetical protein M3153_06750, partial [Chloroflexota bacterium]|nr:hypothetical protein [Chloroflexota bacterium]
MRQLILTLALAVAILAGSLAAVVLLRSPTPAGQPLASPELVGVLVGAGDIAECSANGDEQTAAILD